MSTIAPNQRKKPPTQATIASLAGVAQETVSHILNGNTKKRYSATTEENVKRIAKELGYAPNRGSRTMRKGRSNLIGVIYFGSQYRVGQEIIASLAKAISSQGYDYLISQVQWHEHNPDRAVADMIASRAEGVILVANVVRSFGKGHLDQFERAGIPIVSLYGDEESSLVPLICGDITGRTATLTQHLISMGHRRIMLPVRDGQSVRNIVERINGFCAALPTPPEICPLEEYVTRELPPATALTGIIIKFPANASSDVTRIHYDLAIRLHQAGRLPDALLCSNDQGALGVFAAAMEHGFRIPEDLAITGVDNDPFGSYPGFGLTTAQSNSQQACETSLHLLLRIIEGKTTVPATTRISNSQLIIRTSCGSNNTSTPLP